MNSMSCDDNEGTFSKETVANTNKQTAYYNKTRAFSQRWLNLARRRGEGGGRIESVSTIETNMLASGNIPYA